MLGDRDGLESLPRVLLELDHRNFTADLVQKAAKEIAEERTGPVDSAMSLAMDCSSGASAGRLAEIDKETKGGMLAHLNFPIPDICPSIGVPVRPATDRMPVHSGVPTLFMSGTLDGRTPRSNEEEARRYFNNSQSVLIEGAGHGDDLFILARDRSGARRLHGDRKSENAGHSIAPAEVPMMRKQIPFVMVATSLFSMAGIAQTSAITDVTVINPRNGTAAHHRTVVVTGKRIDRVQTYPTRLPVKVIVIDGRGKYLVPGLWVAHVHLNKAGIESLSLLVANGVTGVRDMGSNLQDMKQWRDQIERGERIGPRLKHRDKCSNRNRTPPA